MAGGLESPEAIRLAFAAGATRVVLGMAVVEDLDLVRTCVAVAGDWLAVGIDDREVDPRRWREQAADRICIVAARLGTPRTFSIPRMLDEAWAQARDRDRPMGRRDRGSH